MAEKAREKFDAQIQCAICLDTFKNPKQLHCNHVYCQQCLAKVPSVEQQDGKGGQLFLKCPTCQQLTAVPQGGVANLPAAFYINNLLEIKEALPEF